MSEFWQGKRVVVTGGAGMVGGFLCQMLKNEGADVVVLTRSTHNKKQIDGAQYIAGSASDLRVCKRVFYEAHAVFNLAASVGGVYFNASHQSGQLWSNFMLQMIPAMAAQERGVGNFLQASSICVYADGYNNPAVEENGHLGEPRPANAGYAWAKRFGEIATHLVFQESDTKYVIVRPTNMYGEGDNFGERSHVIPALIKKFVGGESPITIYNGDCSREFMHVEDGARAMVEAIQNGISGEIYNLGTDGDTQVSIKELACIISLLTDSDAHMEFVNDGIAGDEHRHTDCSKAKRDFGWTHRIDLIDGLYRTIEHYRSKVSCQKQGLVIE
jgi:nucleoside-diphosphate-sugar epimerase